jgi:hypothetical protein
MRVDIGRRLVTVVWLMAYVLVTHLVAWAFITDKHYYIADASFDVAVGWALYGIALITQLFILGMLLHARAQYKVLMSTHGVLASDLIKKVVK